jgi:excisionase family DNA binding protein
VSPAARPGARPTSRGRSQPDGRFHRVNRPTPGQPAAAPKPGHNSGTADVDARVNDSLKAKPSGRLSRIPDRLMTLRDAAQYLSVSYWTVRAWVQSGKLPAVRLPGGGRLLRVEIAHLDRLVDECRDT